MTTTVSETDTESKTDVESKTKTPTFTPTHLGPSTRAVHAGSSRSNPYHALIEPVFHTSTYTFEDTADVCEYMEAHKQGIISNRVEYGRYGNPTVNAAEIRLASLEGAESALLFPSGMAAVTTILLSLLSSGDHVVMTDDCYRRTRQFCLEFLQRFNITCTVTPMGDYAALEDAIRPNTRLLISETPTNPYLRILDVERFAEIARRAGVLSLVDATFATPLNLRPLDWGVDLVLHSATKYLAGHNDLLAGVVAGSENLIAPLRESIGVIGGIADPNNAYLLVRGLKTLSLRVSQQNQNGLEIARFLSESPAVEDLWYPGLPSHPDYEVAVRQMTGFGGVVSFTIRGGLEITSRFIDRLQIPYISPSLGGLESLVIQPALMSYYDFSPEERHRLGIRDNLVRLALGIEDGQDLIADLQEALLSIYP